jgi:diguanylate cyclase (GGDEF)-like protein
LIDRMAVVEELAESLRIDRLTAEFYYRDTERDFRHYIRDSRIRDTRQAIALAALFYLAFAVTDFMVMNGQGDYLLVMLLRMAVCTVGLGAVIVGQKYWWHLVSGLIPTLVVGFALAAFLISTMIVPLQYGIHGMGMMVMLAGVYVFIPNRYILSLSVSVVASLFFIIIIVDRYDLGLGAMATLAALILVTNVLGAITAYRLSRLTREEYRDHATLRVSHQKLKIAMDERLRLEDVLRRRAEIDDVTGAPNRSALFEHAEKMLACSNETTRPLSVLLCDVDYFKQFNGTYGHLRSDEVLKALVAVSDALLSGEQYLARLGGEEFVILLPGSELPEAVRLAERVRAECQRTPVVMGDVSVHFTISIGVAQYRLGDSINVTLRRVDEAMAAAKYKGRNRVEVAN